MMSLSIFAVLVFISWYPASRLGRWSFVYKSYS